VAMPRAVAISASPIGPATTSRPAEPLLLMSCKAWHDSPHRAEQSDERRGGADAGQHHQATVEPVLFFLHLAAQAALQNVLLVAAVLQVLFSPLLHVAQRGKADEGEARQRPGGIGRCCSASRKPFAFQKAWLNCRFSFDSFHCIQPLATISVQVATEKMARTHNVMTTISDEEKCGMKNPVLIVFEFKGNRHFDPGNDCLAARLAATKRHFFTASSAELSSISWPLVFFQLGTLALAAAEISARTSTVPSMPRRRAAKG